MKKAVFYLVLFLMTPPFLSAQDTYISARLIDGDTFKLSNGQKLKLAGINAPEIHDNAKLRDESRKFGKDIWLYRTLGGEAAKAAGQILALGGDQVRLESGTEAFDPDGNLFAYVYVRADRLEKDMVPDDKIYFKKNGHYEIFLNAYLVKTGWAEVISMPLDTEHQGLFLELQREAKENKLGMWA